MDLAPPGGYTGEIIGDAAGMVGGVIATATEWASNAQSEANGLINKLVAEAIDSSLPSSELPPLEIPDSLIFNFNLPEFDTTIEDFNVGDAPAPPEMTLPEDISVNIPEENFDFVENTYDVPTIEIGNPPPDNTSLETIELPAMPDIVIPPLPEFTDIEIPDEPNIDLPAFSANVPSINSSNSPEEFKYEESPYNSDIKVDLFKKILDDIRNGGTGLAVNVERELYDRGRERQRVENERLYKEVENQFSATGFNLPSGAFAYRMLEISNEISRKNDQLNREITINQADLAQKNTHFTVEQARQLEGMLIEFFNQQQNRVLDAAKATAQNAVDIYNSIVAGYQLQLEKYKAEAAVFEQKIRAELSAVEMYKTKVEASKAKADVQQARANLYKSQVEGIQTFVNMYATQMESAKIQAEIQRSRIEQYRSQIEAYVSGLQVEQVKADIYRSQMQGENSRAQAFTSRVEAYKSKVSAKAAEIDAKGQNAQAKLQVNQAKLEGYRGEIAAYQAQMDTQKVIAQLKGTSISSTASVLQSQAGAKAQEIQAQSSQYQAKIAIARAQAETNIARMEAVQHGYVALKELQVKGIEGATNATSQMAASAMNAINGSASFGGSANQSHNYGHSQSESEGISESHIYHHS